MISLSFKRQERNVEKHRFATAPMLAATCSVDDINHLQPDRYYFQPLLKGIRAMWNPETMTLNTSDGTQIHSVDHIVAQLKNHSYPDPHPKSCLPHMGEYPVDGVICAPGLSEKEMKDLISRKKPNSKTMSFEFHVFDIAWLDRYAARTYVTLRLMLETSHVKKVPACKIKDEFGIRRFFMRCLDMGHDGIVLKKKSETYQPGRSAALVKITRSMDMEKTTDKQGEFTMPVETKSFTKSPMLAATGNIDNINFPADRYLCQPKLNGIRAMWDPEKKGLYTRNGNRIYSVKHIVDQLMAHPCGQYPLDGEIYTGDLSFQKLNGLARRKRSSDDTAALEFHVFDIALDGMTAVKRVKLLNSLPETSHIKRVVTDRPKTETDIRSFYRRYLDQGHEGIILRKKSEKYRPGRSAALVKIKPVQDMEAELVGFADAEDDSKNRRTFGSLILRLANGVKFRCAGLTDSERYRLWVEKPIGALVTFKYGAVSDDGTPVFPRYSHIRWDTAAELFPAA
ncbi:hypothetical protein [Desulfotignum balticum]|uniref:ATP-dependent DNA ligase n=1 Tax=Desulfotignum balticum TaxID=115781 RepID=UPI0004625D6C|nr:hypothetical protein [Desulfotignum balticum]